MTNQNLDHPTPLNATLLTQTLTPSPRLVPTTTTIASSPTSICTDHMILAHWTTTTGWSAPALQPYAPLSLPPTASCLHYATTCFEGLKAYRGDDNRLRLFRLPRNAARFARSAARVSLPAPDPIQLAALVRALLAVDAPRWLPADYSPYSGDGDRFLYVRPTLIGTQAQLGVQRPTSALLFIVASYMPRPDTPGGLRLQTPPAGAIRAWPGGFVHAKVGANYGPTVVAGQEAAAAGFGQVLWLYGEEGWCTEAGGSNFFVVWRRKGDAGVVEVVTAPLGDGLILDGVTRGSCLELVRERLGGEVEVVERGFGIKEVMEAGVEGRLMECFVAGTAWFICAVSQIRHRGQDIHIGMGPHGNGGEITTKIKGWLSDIMYGRVEHEWAEVVPEAVKQER